MSVPWELFTENTAEAHDLFERLPEVAAADPLVMDEIMRGLTHEEAHIRTLAAELVDRVTQERPLFLSPYKRLLVYELSKITQPTVRAKIALFYGRVFWDEWDLQQVVQLLAKWARQEDDVLIVVHSLLSLHLLAQQKEWIVPELQKEVLAASTHSLEEVRGFAAQLQEAWTFKSES